MLSIVPYKIFKLIAKMSMLTRTAINACINFPYKVQGVSSWNVIFEFVGTRKLLDMGACSNGFHIPDIIKFDIHTSLPLHKKSNNIFDPKGDPLFRKKLTFLEMA